MLTHNSGRESTSGPEQDNRAILKGMIDTYGLDAIVGILSLRNEVVAGKSKARVVDITDDERAQMTVFPDHVAFVSGGWHGELPYDEARGILNEVIAEVLKDPSSSPE